MQQLQIEINGIKEKNHTLSRFKKDLSAQHNNNYSQSTRDISIDQTHHRQEAVNTKEMEKKLQEYVMGVVKEMEQRIVSAKAGGESDYHHGTTAVSRKTRVKPTSPTPYIQPPEETDVIGMKSDFGPYYTQPTQKGENCTGNNSKQKKKEKSKSKRKGQRESRSKERVSLKSVG